MREIRIEINKSGKGFEKYDCSALIEIDGKPHFGGATSKESLLHDIEFWINDLIKDIDGGTMQDGKKE